MMNAKLQFHPSLQNINIVFSSVNVCTSICHVEGSVPLCHE